MKKISIDIVKSFILFFIIQHKRRSIMDDISELSKEEPNFISRAGKTGL